MDQRHAAVDQAVDAHLQYRRGTLRSAHRLRRRQHAAPRRHRAALLSHARRRQNVDRDQHRHRRRRRRQHDPRRPAAARAAVRWHRYAGLGLVRRRRSLAVAAAQHAGHLGARSAGQGRCEVPLRRSHRRHAWPRVLDSRRRDAAPPDAAARAALARNEPYLFKPATGRAGALRRQRSDAVATRAPRRRERAARRADRLLPAAGCQAVR